MKRLIVLLLALPSGVSAQATGGSGWIGGAIGGTTMGGDFTGVSAGPLLRAIGGYVGPAGFGIAGALHGSFHTTNDDDINLILGHITAGPRLELGAADRSGRVFFGVHIVASQWSADVPNPLTLENTRFTAEGFGIGFNAGFFAVSAEGLQVEIEVGYQSIGYGDTSTEAFTFADTSTRANQLNIQIGFAKVFRKKDGG